MPVQYVNRKGKIYFLHEGKTKKGNPQYTFSQCKDEVFGTIPDGYEIYENPNAQIFLRRLQPKLITEKEEEQVREKFRALIERKYCKLTIEKKSITIYFADLDVERMRELWKNTPVARKEGVEVLIDREITYSPVIRFALQSRKEGLFIAKVVDYEKGNRQWQILESANSLEVLVSIMSEQINPEAYYSFPL
jgi:hypothetical protein